MALSTSFINLLSFVYPFGNTPAVCLTDELPPEVPAECLLLGCGDVRNVLFTTWSQGPSNRRLDFTCCDLEPGILARNILCLTLILDDHASERTQSTLNIYYQFFLSVEDAERLHAQTDRLLDLSSTLKTWHSSPYGHIIRFCSELTLRNVRKIWSTISASRMAHSQPSRESKRLLEHIDRARRIGNALSGEYTNLTGIRAASPVGLHAAHDLSQAHAHFWNHGVLSTDPKVLEAAQYPNALVESFLTDTKMLHYGLDPLLGFHIATAYIPLKGRAKKGSQGIDDAQGVEKLFRASHFQFRSWCDGFRTASNHIVVRFLMEDALAACRTLRDIDLIQFEAHPHHRRLLPGTPSTFNIIETSNLADHLGLLNLLLMTAPLLRSSDEATLRTDLLVQHERDMTSTMANILRGDFATMSLLLGLFPIDMWSGACMVAPDEAIMQLIIDQVSSNGRRGQSHWRMSWKKSAPLKAESGSTGLEVSAEDLTSLLFSVYLKMFACEDASQSMTALFVESQSIPQRLITPHYNRRSFAALIAHMKTRVTSDWDTVLSGLVLRIDNDSTLSFGRNYIQELYMYLHLHGVYSTDILRNGPPSHQSLRRSSNLPSILFVTLVVPRDALSLFTNLSSRLEEVGTPAVHALVGSPGPGGSASRQNAFAALQLIFGSTRTIEGRNTVDSQLQIDAQDSAWSGSSPLLVTFAVPAWLLLLEPDNATVAFALQGAHLASLRFRTELGSELVVFKTKLRNESSVLVSAHPPVVSRLGLHPSTAEAWPQTKGIVTGIGQCSPSGISAELSSGGRLKSIRGRISIDVGPTLDALRAGSSVTTSQGGPLGICVRVDKAPQSLRRIVFPIPVKLQQCSTRIARKSAFIEVVAKISTTDVMKNHQDQLSIFFFPGSTPALWNVPRLNADLQPTLNIQGDLPWLNSHVSFQWSEAERKIREKYLSLIETCPSARVNLKDSIFSLFMHYTGSEGAKAQRFGLNVVGAGGIHILILPAGLRLDNGSHTLFLDAAVLPLTEEILQPLRPFLERLPELQLCGINVDIDELKLWHQILPLYVERCRTWSHKPECEYLVSERDQTPWSKSQNPLCTCGRNTLDGAYLKNLPRWDVARKFAVRAAISPLYPNPFMEEILRFPEYKGPCCYFCKATQKEGLTQMSACGRCKRVNYCSKACQKRDWPRHKSVCKSSS